MTYLKVFRLALPLFQKVSFCTFISESYTLGKDLGLDGSDEVELLMDIEVTFDIIYTSKEADELFTSTNTVKEICESIKNKIMEKSNVKPVVIKKTPAIKLKNLPYSVEQLGSEKFATIKEIFQSEEVSDIFGGGDDYFVVLKDGEELFGFEILEFPRCCGASVLGEFSFGHKLTPANWIKMEPEIMEIINTVPQLKVNQGRTLTCTTATSTPSDYLGKALAKCNFWTAVKSWKNPNSANTVTLWVSNNK